MDDLKTIIAKVATGASLTRDEAAATFERLMSGEATPSQLGGILMALRVRGETVDEITGAVSATVAPSTSSAVAEEPLTPPVRVTPSRLSPAPEPST